MAGSKAVPSSSKMDSTPKSAKPHKRKRDVETCNATTPTPTKKHKKRESLPSAVSPANDGGTTKRQQLKDALQGSDTEKVTRKASATSPEKRKKDRVGESGTKPKDGKRKGSGKDSREAAESTAVSSESGDENEAEESS